MTTTASVFQQNFSTEKKAVDTVQKDVRKWVDSVVEFKASLDKKKSEPPPEKHLKKIKKLKVKKKSSPAAAQVNSSKNAASVQRKSVKSKKISKGSPKVEKSPKKDSNLSVDKFDQIKESYRALKLPQNWTSGISGGRIVFNRIKVTTHNSQQKMCVERSLVITKDCNAHVLLNGSEIVLTNWEMQKVDTLDDIKRAIRDIDVLKICEGPVDASKTSQNYAFLEAQHKTCAACKSEAASPQKLESKSSPSTKKPALSKHKGVTKQKSYQK